MKRTEMVDHIYEEIADMLVNRQYSNETDMKYYRRKADALLTMIEGFGMLPPFNRPWMDSSNGESSTDIRNYKWDKENEKT